MISPSEYLPIAMREGEEHRLWPSADRMRYWKATFPGGAGFMVICIGATEAQPELTSALPLEYLERLQLQNQLFGDGIRLEGIALEAGKTVIVTSQPILIGQPPDENEITASMAKLWFKTLHGLHLGRPGSLAFYRDLDEVAAFDAHPGNFVKDTQGIVLPIDLILVRANPGLQKALEQFL